MSLSGTVSNDTWSPLDFPGGLELEQFTRELWNNLPQLRCIYCDWDTLNGIEEARKHAQFCTTFKHRRLK